MSDRRRGRPAHDDVLTPAEWRTVHAVRHGLTNAAIAKRFGISVSAVNHHVEHALSKLGLPNRRALRQWSGAPKGSPFAPKEAEMGEVLAIERVGQIGRTVSDVAIAEAWYRDVLGLQHLFTFGTMAFFDCGGTRLMLVEKEVIEPESILYFSVTDILGCHAALVARGVQVISAPHLIHRHEDGSEEWMLFFNDPDGRPLAFMERRPGA